MTDSGLAKEGQDLGFNIGKCSPDRLSQAPISYILVFGVGLSKLLDTQNEAVNCRLAYGWY